MSLGWVSWSRSYHAATQTPVVVVVSSPMLCLAKRYAGFVSHDEWARPLQPYVTVHASPASWTLAYGYRAAWYSAHVMSSG